MTMISATFVLAGCTANAPRHQVDLSKSYHKEQPEAHELIAEQSRQCVGTHAKAKSKFRNTGVR